ncbi:MAG: hypothetical protein ACXWJU_07105 [Hyphomicrobium sp.]
MAVVYRLTHRGALVREALAIPAVDASPEHQQEQSDRRDMRGLLAAMEESEDGRHQFEGRDAFVIRKALAYAAECSDPERRQFAALLQRVAPDATDYWLSNARAHLRGA